MLLAPAGADAAQKPRASNVTVKEGTPPASATAVLKVRLSAKPRSTVRVKFATANGTAAAPGDYAARRGTLRFKKGQRLKRLPIRLRADALDEPNETFRVKLTMPGRKPRRSTAKVTIVDDDTPPILSPAPTLTPAPIPGPTLSPASQQIAAARGAPDGAASLPIEGVTVTFVKPPVGSEPSGFFVQDEQAGPALYIDVDPSPLTPVPVAGDVVGFTVSGMGTTSGQRRATSIADFARTATGADVSALVKDVSSSTDLVSALTSYESEVIDLDATLSGPFTSAGTDHMSVAITTAGFPSVDSNLRLRLATALVATYSLTEGCAVHVESTPFWRSNNQAQPSAWSDADLSVQSCPP